MHKMYHNVRTGMRAGGREEGGKGGRAGMWKGGGRELARPAQAGRGEGGFAFGVCACF